MSAIATLSRFILIAPMLLLHACSVEASKPSQDDAVKIALWQYLHAGLAYDEALGGPWRLMATDTRDQMMVCRRPEGDRDSCFGDMLGGETVFAAGIDEKYVVYARHPREWPAPPDRSVSEYFYVIRSAVEGQSGGLGPNDVKGPFDEAQFSVESKRLGLPAFSRVFEDLK